MDISKLKIAWKYLTGGMGGVADYLLDILNNALGSLDAKNVAKVQAVANTALRVSGTLKALSWLCPTKWQTAYSKTIVATETVVKALEDLNLTTLELNMLVNDFSSAVRAWKTPDDITCFDMENVED